MFRDHVSFAQRTRELLIMEREAEAVQALESENSLSPAKLQAQGLALLNLQIGDDDCGLDGRRRLELLANAEGGLPANRFRPGTPVRLVCSSTPEGIFAVVSRSNRERIRIVLDGDPEDRIEGALSLHRRPGDQSWKRLLQGMDRLQHFTRGPAARIIDLVFGQRSPAEISPPALAPLNDRLDESQRQAVAFALATKDIALIHGPPGTGKTTTLVELIRQEVRIGNRVIACAPTNVAVDNLAEGLAVAGLDLVRLGHPARVHPLVQEHTLDAKCARHEDVLISEKLKRQALIIQRRAERAQGREARGQLFKDMRELRKEMRELEDRAREQILADAQVVLCTTTGAGHPRLNGSEFDVAIVDEAAQALEAATWLPLLKARKAVLAGDHRQLPAVIHSAQAEREGLGTTLFERMLRLHESAVARQLTQQYRMNNSIMNWSNLEFYNGQLHAHESVAQHRLCDLDPVEVNEETEPQLLLIDTAGCDFDESLDARGESRSNEGEAGLVLRHLKALMEAGVAPEEVAVITPYLAQVQEIRDRIAGAWPGVEIDSVDGFQGREKEAVILSLVRSNRAGEIGFLADERRLNVAITRGRRQVTIIGDTATIGRNALIGRLIDICSDVGEYRSAWQYMD